MIRLSGIWRSLRATDNDRSIEIGGYLQPGDADLFGRLFRHNPARAEEDHEGVRSVHLLEGDGAHVTGRLRPIERPVPLSVRGVRCESAQDNGGCHATRKGKARPLAQIGSDFDKFTTCNAIADLAESTFTFMLSPVGFMQCCHAVLSFLF